MKNTFKKRYIFFEAWLRKPNPNSTKKPPSSRRSSKPPSTDPNSPKEFMKSARLSKPRRFKTTIYYHRQSSYSWLMIVQRPPTSNSSWPLPSNTKCQCGRSRRFEAVLIKFRERPLEIGSDCASSWTNKKRSRLESAHHWSSRITPSRSPRTRETSSRISSRPYDIALYRKTIYVQYKNLISYSLSFNYSMQQQT